MHGGGKKNKLSPSADLCAGVRLVGLFCAELHCELSTWVDQGMA